MFVAQVPAATHWDTIYVFLHPERNRGGAVSIKGALTNPVIWKSNEIMKEEWGVEERNICFHWRVPPLAGRHFDSVYCHKSINHGVHSLSMGVCSQESGQCHKQLKVVTE